MERDRKQDYRLARMVGQKFGPWYVFRPAALIQAMKQNYARMVCPGILRYDDRVVEILVLPDLSVILVGVSPWNPIYGWWH